MISNKTLAIVAFSLLLTTTGYAEKNAERVGGTDDFVNAILAPARFAYSFATYPFKKAGNIVYYSAQTVAAALQTLKPAAYGTMEAAKLALFVGAILATAYGIGAVTQNSYPNSYPVQFYDYAKPLVQQAGQYAMPVAQQVIDFGSAKYAELQQLIK